MSKVLVVPDIHLPYQRASFLKDLSRLVKLEKPTKIVLIGDVIDSHGISSHQPEPDRMGTVEEMDLARAAVHRMASIFGKCPVYLCTGNHELRLTKAAGRAGIPEAFMKHYRDILGLPSSWNIAYEHILDGVLYTHGKSAVSGKTAHAYCMPAVEGHLHSKFYIEYFVSPTTLLWSAHVGAACDDGAIAMRYANNSLAKSIYGFLVVDSGVPRLIKM
jgi:metallophosphoesterase superfamily enzyme